jgi:HAD superfamily hydrolase (TIGR01509 family)
VAPVRGVIFDLDGTLVDSNDAHVIAWVEALAEFGWTVTPGQVRPLIGMGGDKLLPALIGVREDGPDGRPIVRRRARIFARMIPDLRPFPGVDALLVALRRRGLRLALASSASAVDVDPLLRAARLHDRFDAIVTSDDADRSKPDPDLVSAALARLELAPGEVVLIGDTPYDIAAARRADVDTIAFRCGGSPDEALTGAVAVHDGPADLLAHLGRSRLTRA